jgi:hypothetical protein
MYSMHSRLVTAARFSSCFVSLLPFSVSIFVASCFNARPIWLSFIELVAIKEISACFFPFKGADVGADLVSGLALAGVPPERPGVAS